MITDGMMLAGQAAEAWEIVKVVLAIGVVCLAMVVLHWVRS